MDLMRLLVAFCLVVAGEQAQPGCPAVNFQGGISAHLKPSSSSHTTIVRQSDGSFTAYEMTDSSPYRIIRATPSFGVQLTGCLPKQPMLPLWSPPQSVGTSPGAPSQPQAFARLASGVYLLFQSW